MRGICESPFTASTPMSPQVDTNWPNESEIGAIRLRRFSFRGGSLLNRYTHTDGADESRPGVGRDFARAATLRRGEPFRTHRIAMLGAIHIENSRQRRVVFFRYFYMSGLRISPSSENPTHQSESNHVDPTMFPRRQTPTGNRLAPYWPPSSTAMSFANERRALLVGENTAFHRRLGN